MRIPKTLHVLITEQALSDLIIIPCDCHHVDIINSVTIMMRLTWALALESLDVILPVLIFYP